MVYLWNFDAHHEESTRKYGDSIVIEVEADNYSTAERKAKNLIKDVEYKDFKLSLVRPKPEGNCCNEENCYNT